MMPGVKAWSSRLVRFESDMFSPAHEFQVEMPTLMSTIK